MSTSPHIGTAGWSYPHWNGLVYPKVYGSGFHPLEFLSRRFDTVEINSSFYQHLKPEVVRLWMKKVEANPPFQFTAKLHQRFIHRNSYQPCVKLRITFEPVKVLICLQERVLNHIFCIFPVLSDVLRDAENAAVIHPHEFFVSAYIAAPDPLDESKI